MADQPKQERNVTYYRKGSVLKLAPIDERQCRSDAEFFAQSPDSEASAAHTILFLYHQMGFWVQVQWGVSTWDEDLAKTNEAAIRELRIHDQTPYDRLFQSKAVQDYYP